MDNKQLAERDELIAAGVAADGKISKNLTEYENVTLTKRYLSDRLWVARLSDLGSGLAHRMPKTTCGQVWADDGRAPERFKTQQGDSL